MKKNLPAQATGFRYNFDDRCKNNAQIKVGSAATCQRGGHRLPHLAADVSSQTQEMVGKRIVGGSNREGGINGPEMRCYHPSVEKTACHLERFLPSSIILYVSTCCNDRSDRQLWQTAMTAGAPRLSWRVM